MIIPDEVKRLARADEKIKACHALRQETYMGLSEAKQIIDIIAAGGEVQLPTPAPTAPIGETREQHVRRQLEGISDSRRADILADQEITKLLEILLEDENLLALANATFENCSGVLVATKKRLLFMSRETADGPDIQEFPFDQIYLVYLKARQLPLSLNNLMSAFGMTSAITNLPVTSSIKIFMPEFKRAEFTNMEQNAAKSMADVLKFQSKGQHGEYYELGPWDELEQLEALYSNGTISGPEFAAGKRKVQDQIKKQSGRHPKGKPRPS